MELRRFWVLRPDKPLVKDFAEIYELVQKAPTHRMPNVKFNASMHLPEDLKKFSVLTRYLIVNETTGSVHLFRF